MIRLMASLGLAAIAVTAYGETALARHYADSEIVGTSCYLEWRDVKRVVGESATVKFTRRMKGHYGEKCWFAGGRHYASLAPIDVMEGPTVEHAKPHHTHRSHTIRVETTEPKRVYPTILPPPTPAPEYAMVDTATVRGIPTAPAVPAAEAFRNLQDLLGKRAAFSDTEWSAEWSPFTKWIARDHSRDFDRVVRPPVLKTGHVTKLEPGRK